MRCSSRTVPVALRKESVDRNTLSPVSAPSEAVALRKESVDRNSVILSLMGNLLLVALRKESVDRNSVVLKGRVKLCQSLSARRAWIEI